MPKPNFASYQQNRATRARKADKRMQQHKTKITEAINNCLMEVQKEGELSKKTLNALKGAIRKAKGSIDNEFLLGEINRVSQEGNELEPSLAQIATHKFALTLTTLVREKGYLNAGKYGLGQQGDDHYIPSVEVEIQENIALALAAITAESDVRTYRGDSVNETIITSHESLNHHGLDADDLKTLSEVESGLSGHVGERVIVLDDKIEGAEKVTFKGGGGFIFRPPATPGQNTLGTSTAIDNNL